MDFEYKKYVLLAYLKSCRESFGEAKLYPPLGSLVQHYQNLSELSRSLEQLQSAFPKDLSGIDLAQLKLEYEHQRMQDESISTLTEIMDFALPSLKHAIEEGKEIYELVEKNLHIQPVGIIPVYNQEGYVLINEDRTNDVHVFQYQHSIVVTSPENLRSLSLKYVCKEVKSLVNTFEQIKLNLIRRFQSMPQPAAYSCISSLHFPLLETLLPVTKRVLLTKVFP